jgi:hypothetical protein
MNLGQGRRYVGLWVKVSYPQAFRLQLDLASLSPHIPLAVVITTNAYNDLNHSYSRLAGQYSINTIITSQVQSLLLTNCSYHVPSWIWQAP